MPKTRNQYSADQKVAILRRHLIDRISIADLCDEYKIHPTMFYQWQAQFFENGSAAFARKTNSAVTQHQLKKNVGNSNRLVDSLRTTQSSRPIRHVLDRKSRVPY